MTNGEKKAITQESDYIEEFKFMDAEKLKRKADHVRGILFMITGKPNDPSVEAELRSLLEEANLEEILVHTCPDFDEWMETLPTELVPGLGKACWEWIRGWGNGGGDCSTEDQIKGAIDEIESFGRQKDVPKDLADAMYCSMSEYSKTPFEASVLIMDIMNECLAECQTENKEDLQ